MSTILISCGGTGGHLTPGIALAEGLRDRGHRPILLVSEKAIDARLLEKYPDFEFVRVPGAPLVWRPLGFLRFLSCQLKGLRVSLRLIRDNHPGAVVGFGGFTTAAIIVAARCKGVPVALHEANRVPGRAIRWLSRLARRVYLPSGIVLPHISPAQQRAAGLPVRREIMAGPRAQACAALGLQPHLKVLAVLGGSQGATALNEWTYTQLEALAEKGVQVYCVTGPNNDDARDLQIVTRHHGTIASRFVPFSDRMADILSAADLVISRAGAGTIAELVRCGTPAILVPYPYAADNHQLANARNFEDQGAGIWVDQSRLLTLTHEVDEILFQDILRAEFKRNLRRMSEFDTLGLMLDDLETLMDPPATPPARPAMTPRTA